MYLHLSNLVMEITRKCNMKCEHCLRGNAQRVDMSNEIIFKLTSQVDSVYSIAFTGGEPSLNPEAIRQVKYGIQFNDFSVDHFWLTVNARYYKQKFEDAIMDLYSVCGAMQDCILTISGDQFHFDQSRKALEKYSELPFFSDEKMKNISFDSILNEGMAKKNQFGVRELKVSNKICDYELYDNELYVSDCIYVNALGDVLLDCDLSYQSQKKYVLGNVLKESLVEILIRNLKGQKKNLCMEEQYV